MNEQRITGAIALGPVREAAASLDQVLALPELGSDLVVIVGDTADFRHKRGTYRELFTALGRARRPAVWVPGSIDSILEREARQAYGMSEPSSGMSVLSPASSEAGIVQLAPLRTPLFGVSSPLTDVLTELIRTFEPRLAPRVQRPAVYTIHDRGRPEWLEL
ncbi:MAG TPA: hypothetical protein VFD90_14060 [Gaiellales bacterium]|jgi:hypothetical protein|nr:hypothetical protein [Gaiellales bacterium]